MTATAYVYNPRTLRVYVVEATGEWRKLIGKSAQLSPVENNRVPPYGCVEATPDNLIAHMRRLEAELTPAAEARIRAAKIGDEIDVYQR